MITLITKTGYLKVENSVQITFRFSPVSVCTLLKHQRVDKFCMKCIPPKYDDTSYNIGPGLVFLSKNKSEPRLKFSSICIALTKYKRL